MNQRTTIMLRLGVITMLSLAAAPVTALGAHAASTTCSTVAACVFGINNAAGPGVEGSSSTGYGIEGLSRSNDGVVGHTAVNAATAGAGKAGVAGYDDATNHNAFNSGVYGVSSYSSGVQGRSTHGSGVLALALSGGTALSAVAGPNTRYTGFTNAAVVGQSASGDGIIGIGNTAGVVGFAANDCLGPNPPVVNCPTPLQNEIPSGGAVTAATDTDGLGLQIKTDTNPFLSPNSPNGVGATIDAGSLGLMITSDRAARGFAPGLVVSGDVAPRGTVTGFQGAIVTGYNALSVTGTGYGIAVTGSEAVFAQSSQPGSMLFEGAASNGSTVAQLNDAGNLKLSGKLTQRGTLTSGLRNVDGTYSAAYGAATTVPTVDDMGEANLIGGSAYVHIDAALSKSTDVARGYLVFLTPQGQTTGLYVTGKSRAGFTVREIGAARDSIAFDYRIVVRPYGETGQRLAPLAESIRSHSIRSPLFYRHITPLRFKRGALQRDSLPKPSM